MDYCVHNQNDINEIFKNIGISSFDELFKDIPEKARIQMIDIPEGKTEQETENFINAELNKNKIYSSFCGYGVYNHYVPAAIDFIVSRSEFFTAYTPYQPELSQGTLKSIFEYQTNISKITGMDISNASLYDGASAAAESVLMSLRLNRKRKQIIILDTVNPKYISVIQTYLKYQETEIKILSESEIENNISELCSCIIVQYPDFLGELNIYQQISEMAKDYNSHIIMITYPMICGIFKTPGELGADIVCGEAQCFGMHLNSGGSYLGYITCKKEFMRQIPGRVVGKTTDKNGKECYTLTLQAREQHIRRENATSNICSNQSLNAIRCAIYLNLLGYTGLNKICVHIFNLTQTLKNKITEIFPEFISSDKFCFNEFSLKINKIDEFINFMKKNYNINPGIKISYNNKTMLLVSITEKNNINEINNFVEGLKKFYYEK